MKKIEKLKKINLGCGKTVKKGFVNLDVKKGKGVDVVWSLDRFPYPFGDNQFEEVVATSIIEHLDNPDKFIKELWRICAPNCKILITAPHYSNPMLWTDLTHRKGYSLNSFMHYDDDCTANSQSLIRGIQKFKIKKRLTFGKTYKIFELFAKRFPDAYEYFLSYIFPARMIYYNLTVVKKM